MTAPETPGEKAEKAKIRRRWITLGEVLGVAAVAISGLTFYTGWSDRRAERAEKSVAESRESRAGAVLLLRATPSKEADSLALVPRRDEQAIQSQTIRFPKSLGVAPVETTGDPRIEAGWFGGALRTARKTAGRPNETAGDERLPIAIETHFLVGDTPQTDIALYDVGYAVEGGGLFGGADVRLRGLSLVERASAATAQARLDALWAKRQPTISSAAKK